MKKPDWSNISREEFHKSSTSSILHRTDGPAVIEYHLKTGRDQQGTERRCPRMMVWYQNGVPGRPDGLPHKELYNESGGLYEVQWLDASARIHSNTGPAAITLSNPEYENNESEVIKSWYSYGKIHRIGKPAIIGNRGTEMWLQDGHIHRIGGPAATIKNKKRIIERQWRIQGMCHRLDGPAIEREDGSVEYWISGKLVDELQHMAISLKLDNIRDPILQFEKGKLTKVEPDSNTKKNSLAYS